MTSESLDEAFNIQIFSQQKADVYLSCSFESKWSRKVIYRFIKEFDYADIRMLGYPSGLTIQDISTTRHIMSGCAGFLSVLPFKANHSLTTEQQLANELKIGIEMGLPVAVIKEEGVILDNEITLGTHPFTLSLLDKDSECRSFIEVVLKFTPSIRPYVFVIGRLEPDFRQAREAIRAAVEKETGIPCLWIDDGRHKTNIEGIRERTRLLIKNAEFVIADLTLGLENPIHENPSRAHEIGMAIAYGKPIFLCSQEPRRIPYYSISDMQMLFWSTEEVLESTLRNWLSMYRKNLGRTVYNDYLNTVDIAYQPKITSHIFKYNPKLRYIGPHTDFKTAMNKYIIATTTGTLAFSLFYLLTHQLSFYVSLGIAMTSGLMMSILTWASLTNIWRQLQAPQSNLAWFLLIISAIILLLVLTIVYHYGF